MINNKLFNSINTMLEGIENSDEVLNNDNYYLVVNTENSSSKISERYPFYLTYKKDLVEYEVRSNDVIDQDTVPFILNDLSSCSQLNLYFFITKVGDRCYRVFTSEENLSEELFYKLRE